MADFFRRTDLLVQRVLRILVVALFLVLALLLATNVALRLTNDLATVLTERGFNAAAEAVRGIIPIGSMHWFDEIVEMCFAAMIFYGSASLWAVKGHFCVGDWISPRIRNFRTGSAYRLLTALLGTAFMAVFFRYSLRLTLHSTELTTVFQIPKSLLYSCMPVSSFIMLIYSLADCLREGKALLRGKSADSPS
ncbi:MAG: TRAP transporter small permease [Aminivibrio sp.]|jgi:TRAP-type C4-dicarboxylate transport system permease small subunit|nr:TRAP transporter small permease [Aminivibrio sp.]